MPTAKNMEELEQSSDDDDVIDFDLDDKMQLVINNRKQKKNKKPVNDH